jgi:putative phosphoesterase
VKLGILSDSHDQTSTAIEAVHLLRLAGAQQLIHCGDVGGTQILDVLAGMSGSVFVFGNTDYDREELSNYAKLIGVRCGGVSTILEIAGKRIGVTHGDDPRQLARLTRPDQQVDYLLTGHTHIRHDRRSGDIRLINPGALHRAPKKTVATLDLLTDELVYLTLPGQ